MPTIGRRPAGNEVGVGIMAPSTARASIASAVSQPGWLTRLGARVGRNTGSSPTAQIALYTGSSSSVGSLVASTGTFSASALMVDNTGGAEYAYAPTSIVKISANQVYALAIRNTGASMMHGMDVSGAQMFRRTGVTSFPSPFNSSETSPEGRISIWADIQTNSKPAVPSGLSPENNAVVTTQTPTFGADFRDVDETAGGASLGNADVLTSYQFDVLNEAKTTTVQSSGKLAASNAQKTARRATWTPTTLAPGRYYVRCTMWDAHNAASNVAEWTFTINVGGTFTSVVLRADVQTPQDASVTNSTTPDVTVTLSLPTGVYMSYYRYYIRQQDTMQLVRGPRAFDWGGSSGIGNGVASFNMSMGSHLANNPLAAGKTYRMEIMGTDTSGISIPWFWGSWWRVNAKPNVPDFRYPNGQAFNVRPILEMRGTDADNTPGALQPEWTIWRVSDTTFQTVGGGSIFYDATANRWKAYTNATTVPVVNEEYRWRGRVTDQYGLVSDWSSWLSFNYVTAPTFSTYLPTNGSTITTARPVLSFVASRTMSAARFYVAAEITPGSETYERVYDSGWIAQASTTASHQLPAGILRNSIKYQFQATARTTDNFERDTSFWYVRLVYPALAPVTGVAVALAPGTFERLDDSTHWSRTRVTWDAIGTGTISEAEWAGYIVRRRNLATLEVETMGIVELRATTVFEDKTPTHQTPYAYIVTALRRANDIEYIETPEVASATISVELDATIITSMGDDNVSVPLWYWKSRKLRRVRDISVLSTWGRRPVAYQGPQNYIVLTGDFQIFDDDFGAYSALEILDALDDICEVTYDEEDRPIPKTVLYRDVRKRNLYMIATDLDEDDQHESDEINVSIELTEVLATTGVDLGDVEL